MVSSHLVEALTSPTDALIELYNSQDPQTLNDFPTVVTEYFSNIFKNEDAFCEIPSLDLQRPPESHRDRSLVRFRAMIQDTSPSSEMYLSKLPSGKCGGWGLHTMEDINAKIDYSDLRDCAVVWAVSVPGESQWVREALDGEASDKVISHEPIQPHKYPLADERHIGVQLKFYTNLGNDAPKMNGILTFVGILTNESLHTESDISLDVPTLHVLFTRPYDFHVLPSLGSCAFSPEEVQKELVSWIAEEALGGDLDAAEWVLLTIIARVRSRTRSLNPPSLTLSHFPSPSRSSDSSTPTLCIILSLLLPTFVVLPLSLDLLNNVPFVPESTQEDLCSGPLQLSSGTTVLITESGVREGKLVERGVLNIMAVQDVMTSQSLSYKFPFSHFSFPTDIQFIVLSEGKKSAFLKTDITVPFEASRNSNLYKRKSMITLPPPEKLAAFRRLVLSAKTGKIEVGETTSERIQEDFVQERKTNKTLSSDDLKLSITTARLMGLTLLEKELTIQTWERSNALEERRKARLD
ncbi:hypothetical protein EW146_g833 [Bondarzewia mesenterica]|uniref:Mini-chromosome maintenance complex-binding protein n=1 Tax=Bondarzewia mesenterica TaxID=1095465 RepID=A0A4S4M5U7_9AGAM|nr:hypothetical protein EW146_g833 [Bondarzewia mesenterica]